MFQKWIFLVAKHVALRNTPANSERQALKAADLCLSVHWCACMAYINAFLNKVLAMGLKQAVYHHRCIT